MTEIQLKTIVDRLEKQSTTGTDGDEFTIKNGIKVSKFSKEPMEIGCWRRIETKSIRSIH
jgi:hypothetical protein